MILVTNRSWLPSSGIVLVLLLPPSWASHGPPQAKGCVQHACGQAKYRTRRARGVRSAVFASWAFPPNRGQRRQALSALARAVVKHRGVALALGSPADGAAKKLGLHAPVLSRLGGEGAGAPHQTNMPTISSYSEHSFVAIVWFVRRGPTIAPFACVRLYCLMPLPRGQDLTATGHRPHAICVLMFGSVLFAAGCAAQCGSPFWVGCLVCLCDGLVCARLAWAGLFQCGGVAWLGRASASAIAYAPGAFRPMLSVWSQC